MTDFKTVCLEVPLYSDVIMMYEVVTLKQLFVLFGLYHLRILEASLYGKMYSYNCTTDVMKYIATIVQRI